MNDDVLQPIGRTGPGRARIVLKATVIGALAIGLTAWGLTARRSTATSTERGSTAGTLVTPDGLLTPSTGALTRLGHPEAQFNDAPTVLMSADRSQALYRTFEYASTFNKAATYALPGEEVGSGSLHLADLSSGKDSVISTTASSVAWAGQGPVGYVEQAGPFRAGQALRGTVMVAGDVSASATSWTSGPANYTALAWAAQHLIVQLTPDDQEGGGRLLSYSGPDTFVALGGDDTELLGVSPDGSEVLVAVASAADGVQLELLDARSGAKVSKVDMTAIAKDVDGLTPSPLGAWAGDTIALSYGQGIALFSFANDTVTATTYLHVATSIAPFVRSPYFTGGHTHVVSLSLDKLPVGPTPANPSPKPFDGHYVLVDCSIATGECTTSATGESANGRQVSVLHNPSRAIDNAREEES